MSGVCVLIYVSVFVTLSLSLPVFLKERDFCCHCRIFIDQPPCPHHQPPRNSQHKRLELGTVKPLSFPV